VKKIILSLFILVRSSIYAQQELHIHHINIENGDATLVGIYDVASNSYVNKILIDGGLSSASTRLLPYIKKMVGTDPESLHFNYVILTHYHNDHYTGLLALKTGKITADSIIDPGGYKVSDFFNHSASAGTKPTQLKIALPWLRALKAVKEDNPAFIKGRSKIMIQYGTGSSSSIGKKIVIGEVDSNPVELKCIAGWGNSLSDNGIDPNPIPSKDNGNNFSLAFILSCGEFRYFIGGDLGGSNESHYINQETSVTRYLEAQYPESFSWDSSVTAKGHVCGFKSNHHGSFYSNTSAFMESMHPAITVTSAGDKEIWHLPNIDFLQRLSNVTSLSTSASAVDSIFNKGVYFTNLYNFDGFPSRTKANNLFKNKPGISYSFGNNTSTAKGSYLIKVTQETLDEESLFEVGRVDINKVNPYTRLAYFKCHITN
jgi:hypothetical protein